jgi:hypothetical protein
MRSLHLTSALLGEVSSNRRAAPMFYQFRDAGATRPARSAAERAGRDANEAITADRRDGSERLRERRESGQDGRAPSRTGDAPSLLTDRYEPFVPTYSPRP